MGNGAFSGQDRVVVDWDGTCVPSAWPEQPDIWLPDAVKVMAEWVEEGLDVQISSTRFAPRALDEATSLTRSDKERERRYVRRMLDEADLPSVGLWLRPWKPGALAYVDDKGVRYDGSWQRVRNEVRGIVAVSKL